MGRSYFIVYTYTEKQTYLNTTKRSQTWQAGALVGGISFLDASAPIVAGRGIAWHIERLAVFASVFLRASAVVGAHLIDTNATVLTDVGILGALIDILLAGRPIEGWWAVA